MDEVPKQSLNHKFSHFSHAFSVIFVSKEPPRTIFGEGYRREIIKGRNSTIEENQGKLVFRNF